MLNFNPRSHEGSDRLRPSDPHSQRLFQSTLPRGERLDHQFISQDIPVFQSTLPRGERRLVYLSKHMSCNFNPRSHEGSDDFRGEYYVENCIFQSTLPRGERRCRSCYSHNQEIYFNPRSHEGSDDLLSDAPIALIEISIHAPTRGATHAILFCFCNLSYFNPRSHEGSDICCTKSYNTTRYFNPRSHEGSDSKASFTDRFLIISIHAPTRGATICSSTLCCVGSISIHAPTRGATSD